MSQRGDSAAAACSTIAELLDLFEDSLQRGVRLRFEDLLDCPPARQATQRRQLLEELIAIDLEYRWRGKPALPAADGVPAERPRLEDYLRRYPELGALPASLIGQEYRVRQCWGDRPGHGDYAARFPGQGQPLLELLGRIDGELAAEFGRDRRGLFVADSAGATVAAAPAAPGNVNLADTLRGSQLLTPTRWSEVERDLTRRFPDSRALARELLRRNWLTPYQVNQLLQGHGRDLLVGPYLLLERLGEGGAGQVFKARRPNSERIVALKVIRKELLTDAETLARFNREIEVLSNLDHPNVVRALDAGSGGGAHYLAMEFVEGTDLGRMVKQNGPLPVLQACAYIRQAALGLQHAHERGLVHRDIKPHNLIMSLRDGLIKVADLGLARLPRLNQKTSGLTEGAGTGTLTPRNALIGTPDYMAPEQALEFHNADIRSDIYSLGCTFYYLLTGAPPFPGGTLAQTLMRHQQAPPPPIEQRRHDLPPGLPAVLGRMLAKRPEERFQTPAEVAAALAAPGDAPAQPVWPWPRLPVHALGRLRQRWRLILAGSGLALVLLAVIPVLFPSDERLRRQCLEVLIDRPGSPQALEAAARLSLLPSPLDQLDSKNIPPELRTANLPAEVVAVLHPGGTPGEAYRVVFSLDGKSIASAGQDGLVHLWNAATGKKRASLQHAGPVRGLAFSPDGRWLASGSDDRSLRVWDLATNKEHATLGKNTHEWDAVTFSLDGKLLVAGSRHGFVSAWDVPAFTRQCEFRARHGIWSLALSPDARTLALAGEQTLEFWKLPAGTELPGPPLKAVRLVAFAPGGQAIAFTASEAPRFRLRDLTGDSETPLALKQQLVSNPRFLEFTPDGQFLLTTVDDATAFMWHAPSKLQVGYWPMPGSSCSESMGGASIAPDGRHLATPHKNGNVYIRRLLPVAKP